MPVKMIMTWDILPGKEQEYFEFVVRDFLPGLGKLGMETTEAWYTYFGNQPQILAAAKMGTRQAMRNALNTAAWEDLTDQLNEYVVNFDYKVVKARGGFQL